MDLLPLVLHQSCLLGPRLSPVGGQLGLLSTMTPQSLSVQHQPFLLAHLLCQLERLHGQLLLWWWTTMKKTLQLRRLPLVLHQQCLHAHHQCLLECLHGVTLTRAKTVRLMLGLLPEWPRRFLPAPRPAPRRRHLALCPPALQPVLPSNQVGVETLLI